MNKITEKISFVVFIAIIIICLAGYFYYGFNDIANLKTNNYRNAIISLIDKGPRVITPLQLNVWMAGSELGIYRFRSMASYVVSRISHNAGQKKQEQITSIILGAFKNEPNFELKREIIGWTTLATANVGLNCLFEMAKHDDDILNQRAFYLLNQISKQEFYKDTASVDKIFKDRGCKMLTEIISNWINQKKYPSRYVERNYSEIMALYKYKEATPVLISILKKENNSDTIQALREVTGQFIFEDPKIYEQWWAKEKGKLKKAN